VASKPRRLKKLLTCYTFCSRESIAIELTAVRGFAGIRGLSRWKVVRNNQLLCVSGGGALVKCGCCDRHNQCLGSVGNLQILQLSEILYVLLSRWWLFRFAILVVLASPL